ncbi:8987_t:CDS:2 [Rhizophagus irregularis]|nr:8987_t:CDS:2 [Rhizophagus irregularis]
MSTLNNTPCNMLECKMCGQIYKRHSSLAKHEKSIKDANTIKPTIYDLPEGAIEETRKMIVYHIKERLKQHSRHAGNVHIMNGKL